MRRLRQRGRDRTNAWIKCNLFLFSFLYIVSPIFYLQTSYTFFVSGQKVPKITNKENEDDWHWGSYTEGRVMGAFCWWNIVALFSSSQMNKLRTHSAFVRTEVFLKTELVVEIVYTEPIQRVCAGAILKKARRWYQAEEQWEWCSPLTLTILASLITLFVHLWKTNNKLNSLDQMANLVWFPRRILGNNNIFSVP